MKKYSLILISILFVSIACNLTPNRNEPQISIENNFYKAIEKFTANIKNSYFSNNNLAQKKLAVLPFVNENGNLSKLGEFISNYVQLKLFDPKTFILLERERIDSLLSEYEFNQNGLVNDLDSKKLAQLLGADLVLVGTISLNKTNNNKLYFAISGRIVNLISGEINAVSFINILSNGELFEKYNTQYNKKLKSTAGTFKITLKDIIISNTKSNGRDWDMLSGPDIYIKINSSLSNIKSDIYYDKYELHGEVFTCNIILGKNDYIHITIYDHDEIEIDTIGNLVITDSQIIDCLNNNKQIETSFDQIKHITIMIEKLE